MKIMVTGGAGYIGSHTVKQLTKEGYEVVVLDNLTRGHEDAINVPLVVGDISDTKFVIDTIEKYNIDACVHFAADSQVGESMMNPIKYYDNNVCGTLSLLTALEETGVKKIVFSSSAAIYGEAKEIIDEDTAKNPTNVYGKTKLMMEEILKDFDRAYGIKSVALRYFNAAGADVSGDIGEDHTPETHIIPIVLQTALGKRSLKIFGDDYPTKDGTCVRDYIHVTDLADAHVKALQYLEKGNDSLACNLGTGNGYSVKQLIETACKVCGCDIPYTVDARRAGDPAMLVASVNKAKTILGWQAKNSDMENIINTAWNWHQKHPNGY